MLIMVKVYRTPIIKKEISPPKKTSIGRKNVGFSTMNKSKKRSYKKYRRQG